MKRILSFVLLTVLALGLASCSLLEDKVVPAAKKAASEKITNAIVVTGECQAVDVVRADVDKLLKIESDEGMIATALDASAPSGSQSEGVVSEICKSAAKLALPALLRKGVPEKWDCQLTDLSSKIGELAAKACGEIPL